MMKGLVREATLAIQSKTGASAGAVVWLIVVAVAVLAAFVFLCVAGYAWLSTLYGNVFAGLIAAGFFFLVAVIAGLLSAQARRRTRERAILARAARAHSGSWLLDPKILATAVQIGRSVGWQRILPVALLGLIAAQWTREYRERGRDEAE
jgi:hypothetical protein